jgi:proline dehydrogenase
MVQYAATMGLVRRAFLAGSESRWLRERAVRHRFVQRAVSRFMPGERLEDALAAAAVVHRRGARGAVLTRLGENVTDQAEADEVTRHYLDVLDRVHAGAAHAEISVKLTQLGLDLDRPRCAASLRRLLERAAASNFVWIDMEGSRYTEVTLAMCAEMRREFANVGVCVQAYLHRTARDLGPLLAAGAGVRLVKGAYNEPAALAFPRKKDVDANYLTLARRLLGEEARRRHVRVVFGTHDQDLIRAIQAHAAEAGLPREACEFHLLYGIQRAEQERLAREGWPVRVLISYGSYWFPWYMRRLAERPANVLFMAKSLVKS